MSPCAILLLQNFSPTTTDLLPKCVGITEIYYLLPKSVGITEISITELPIPITEIYR